MSRWRLKFLGVLIILCSSAVLAAGDAEFIGPVPVVLDQDTAAGKEADTEPKKVSVASFVNSSGEISVAGVELSKNILAEVYSPRDYTTIWFDGKTPNKAYGKALDFISLADENGLSISYFDTEIIKKRVADENQNEEFIAKTDALITHMVVEMIRLIGNGHKIPEKLKLQSYFERSVRVKNSAAAFRTFMEADDINKVIDKYSPAHPQYSGLKKALKKYINRYKGARHLKPIKFSHDLVVGDKDEIITELRRRIGGKISISPGASNDVYDKALEQKVIEFQRKFGLETNGIITKLFIDNVNGHDIDIISRIKANMERYRWLPDELPKTRIEINLPDFTLTAYKDSKEEFSMGVIAGKDEHETPIMNTRLYQFILNPYWNVPKNYAIRNMIPLLRQDPNYVKNQNFDLMRLEKEGWKKIDQSTVNWDTINEDNYNFLLRQRPGNINVLGPIKFTIINPFDIYLHSTSEPWLFSNRYRGYSSGCIRVENPVRFAQFVREQGGTDITDKKFDELYNYYNAKDGKPMPQNPEMNDKVFKLKTPIPAFVTYFSVHANEDGTVRIDDDTYDLDFNQARLLGF